MKAQDRIIVALDVDNLKVAQSLVETLAPYVGCFKVGLELFTALGAPKVVELVHSLGGQVFYDGKFDDIPNTVGGAAKAVARLNVKMFNVHASAGRKSIEAAVANKGNSSVLGVTVLTSIDEEECISIFGNKPGPKVLQLSKMLLEIGVDGIICSPQELELLEQYKELDNLLKVTPGVRPEWAVAVDQKRIMTPAQAIRAGATALVIGRPITKPPVEIGTPIDAARKITEEIFIGLKQRFHLALFNLAKIKFGAFRLKLHETNPTAPLSPIYLNIRELPDWAYELAGDILHDMVIRHGVPDFDYVIGIPKAGEPIGRALATAINKPLIRVEKAESEDGRRISTRILDPFEAGKKVILVDDLITKAHTKREAINSVESNGLQVVATVILYDREQGGLTELNAEGRQVLAVAKLGEVLDFFVKEEKIPSAKRDEVMAYITAN
jgi:orotidine-5'-phosphate decarboxylase